MCETTLGQLWSIYNVPDDYDKKYDWLIDKIGYEHCINILEAGVNDIPKLIQRYKKDKYFNNFPNVNHCGNLIYWDDIGDMMLRYFIYQIHKKFPHTRISYSKCEQTHLAKHVARRYVENLLSNKNFTVSKN